MEKSGLVNVSQPPQMHGDFLIERVCIKQQMHKFQSKTSSWSEIFVCNLSNKAS